MKSISIRELHAATGKHVRATLQEPLIVTERGKRVAVLKPFSDCELRETYRQAPLTPAALAHQLCRPSHLSGLWA